MSKLDELIKEYCRGGVEYKPLIQICTIDKGSQLNKEFLSKEKTEEFCYAVINGGKEPSGFWKTNNFPENRISISQGGASAGFVDFQTSPFYAGGHCFVLTNETPEINYKYLYYCIKNNEIKFIDSHQGKGNGIPSLSKTTVGNLEIPLPPLPVQKEIVRILDLYNTKKTELILNLTKEQNFRNKQYKAYRDKLLAFDASAAKSFAVQNLIDNGLITTVTPSFKLKKNEFKANGNIPIISQELEFISGYCDVCDERIGNHNYICFGDHSEHIKYVDFAFVQGADGLKIMYTDENKLSSRYFYHAMNTYYNRHDNYERHFKYFVETKIPLPSLDVQKRIVDTLDNFDKICTDLNIGLPAEIEARQKEYEFYRNELLSFDYLNAERRTQNAERRTQNAERRTQNAERA